MQVHTRVLVKEGNSETEFTGRITIARKEFNFRLESEVPLAQYQEALTGKSIAEFRKIIKIEIKKGAAEIPLSDEEHYLFYSLIIRPVMTVYEQSIGRRNVLRIEDKCFIFFDFLLHFNPLGCYTLSNPKFGCLLLNEVSTSGYGPH